jgi:FKBP-type peptidyl-prolyl cis-trans isomerase FkpA
MSVTAVPIAPIAKGSMTKLWIGVALVVAVAGTAAYVGAAKPSAIAGKADTFLAWHAKQRGVVAMTSGLQYQVLKAGDGPKPTDADVVLVNYKGALRNGAVFDQAERAPFPVQGVVPGFSEGLKQMQKGGKYRLWIPAALGYGDQSPTPKIPNGSMLVFDVELLDFKSEAEIRAMQQMQQQQQGAGAPPPGH